MALAPVLVEGDEAMIYSPEAVELLRGPVANLVSRLRSRIASDPLFPLKAAAVGAALAALPVVVAVSPATAPVAAAAMANAVADFTPAKSSPPAPIAPKPAPEPVLEGALREVKKAIDEGALLDSAAPRKGMVDALGN
ncbi:MAG TPA: hypothetical protein VFF73_29460 [Planctomycetota bacterium]|nr:hypothetical protein [Planctomycetota bacterium]